MYQKILLEYTMEVLTMKLNWIHITGVAEALLERKTLNYNQIMEVIYESTTIAMNADHSKKLQ